MSVLSEINAEIEAERPKILIQAFWDSLHSEAEVIYKFNGGRGAILCSVCNVILLTGSQIDTKALDTGQMGPQYCEDHQKWVHAKHALAHTLAIPALGDESE